METDDDEDDCYRWSEAVKDTDYNTMTSMIEKKINVNTIINCEDESALLYLCYDEAQTPSKTRCVSLLIENEASLDMRCRSGWTPLICATMRKHYDVMRLLICAKADIELQTNMSSKAIDFATGDILKLLVASGAHFEDDEWILYQQHEIVKMITKIKKETNTILKSSLPLPISGGHYLLHQCIVEYVWTTKTDNVQIDT